MFAKPQAEHEWLAFLVGKWNYEGDCSMGPDQPSQKNTGEMQARSLEGIWVLCESGGDSPEMGKWTSLMTLGYDPVRKGYVGSFFGSMMTHLWQYFGQLDSTGRILTLDTEGPRMDGGGMTKYQDMVEKVSNDHWILRSNILGDDGQWTEFMKQHHHRVGK